MGNINLFPMFLSIKVATTATIMGVLLGIPIAYYLSRSKGKFSDVLDTLLTLPIVLPPTVIGYYLLILLSRQSGIGRFLEENFGIMIVFTPMGAVIASCVVSIPFLIKSARAAFSGVDRDIIHAAELLGRSDINIFLTIIIPLAWRGIVAGVILSFARAIGDFGTTLMVSGSIPNQTLTMPIAIYDAMQSGDKELTTILVAIMTGVAFTFLFILNRLEKKIGKGEC